MKTKIFLIISLFVVASCGGSDNDNGGNRRSGNGNGNAANVPDIMQTNVNTNTNANANANTADNSVVVQKQLAIKQITAPENTEFGGGALPEDWQWFDPDGKNNPTKYAADGNVLRLEVPTGKDLTGENQTAPRLTKVLTGDFEIETKVRIEPRENYQGAGILIFRDEKNFLRLERGKDAEGSGIRFGKTENGVYEAISTTSKNPTEANIVELKIRRAGNEIAAFWREPNGVWNDAGKFSSPAVNPLTVGLIACNTASPIPVEFAYIKLAPVENK